MHFFQRGDESITKAHLVSTKIGRNCMQSYDTFVANRANTRTSMRHFSLWGGQSWPQPPFQAAEPAGKPVRWQDCRPTSDQPWCLHNSSGEIAQECVRHIACLA